MKNSRLTAWRTSRTVLARERRPLTEPSAFEAVHEAVKKAGITPESASVAMIPQNYIKLEASQANTMIRLMEALEEHDDVQNVHSNFDIDQKLLEEVAG